MKFAGLAGILTVFGMAAAGITWMFFHFQTKEIASIQHEILEAAQMEVSTSVQAAALNLAAWDEIGNVENQIRIAGIEIKGLERIGETRPLTDSEQIELESTREKKEALQERLDELIRQQRATAQGVDQDA